MYMRPRAAVHGAACRACGVNVVDVDSCVPPSAMAPHSLWPELRFVEDLVRRPGVASDQLLLAVLPAHVTSSQYYYLVFMTGRLESLRRRPDVYSLVADLNARARAHDLLAVPPFDIH
jgi:hypothetical protein